MLIPAFISVGAFTWAGVYYINGNLSSAYWAFVSGVIALWVVVLESRQC